MQRWQITCQKKLSDSKVPEHAAFLKNLDFAKELSWLKKTIALQPSPVVFCHNDFQEGNILLHETEDNNNFKDDPKLVLIGIFLHYFLCFIFLILYFSFVFLVDFEYCSYNYRGFDIANHLLEWTYDYTASSAPYYKENAENYPTHAQRVHFIENYLAETGSDEQPEHLLDEIRTYSLASHLFWGLWSIVNAGSSQITFGYWVSAIFYRCARNAIY